MMKKVGGNKGSRAIPEPGASLHSAVLLAAAVDVKGNVRVVVWGAAALRAARTAWRSASSVGSSGTACGKRSSRDRRISLLSQTMLLSSVNACQGKVG
jgi:hypothetical protein